jgi:hypothetical protein
VTDSTLTITAGVTDANYSTVGTTTKQAVAGEADFTGTGFGIAGTAGTGKTLNFSTVLGNGTAVNTTQTIALTAGTAVELAMGQQPSTVETGTAISPAPTVIVRDAWHNPVLTDSSSTVTAQLYRNGSTAGTNQNATKTAASGTATFSGVTTVAPSTTGYYYRYTLTSNGATVDSNTFEIAAGAPNSIVVTTAPNTYDGTSRTKSGGLLKIQPTVQLLDASGNVATQVNSGTITISVNGTGGSVAGGQTTANIVNGVATFTGVKVSRHALI